MRGSVDIILLLGLAFWLALLGRVMYGEIGERFQRLTQSGSRYADMDAFLKEPQDLDNDRVRLLPPRTDHPHFFVDDAERFCLERDI